jgi:hypothetical protein
MRRLPGLIAAMVLSLLPAHGAHVRPLVAVE